MCKREKRRCGHRPSNRGEKLRRWPVYGVVHSTDDSEREGTTIEMGTGLDMDMALFLSAEDSGELIGSNWTKGVGESEI